MYLAIDIGGTKTLLSVFSKNGLRLRSCRFKTPPSPELFQSSLQRSLKRLFPARPLPPQLNRVIIAFPGIIQHNRPYRAPNLPEWDHFDLPLSVEKCIKNLYSSNRVKSSPRRPDLLFINDANAAALYEAKRYKGKVVYLTLSTGIGGGLVQDGRLLSTSDTFEPGHTIYLYNGEHKEWEDLAAASAIRKLYGRPVTTLKDPEIFDDLAARLSLGLTDIIRSERPQTVILGGPLSLLLSRFITPLRHLLRSTLPPSTKLPKIVRAKRPHESVIYGCYLYGKTHHQSTSEPSPNPSTPNTPPAPKLRPTPSKSKSTPYTSAQTTFIAQLRADFPQFTIKTGPRFTFRPPKTVIIGPPEPNFALLALHELGHALSGHFSYSTHVERLKIESEAWEAAKTLCKTYQISYDDAFVETQLDTYRDWLHTQSKCKTCGLTRYQTPDGTYHCPHCDGLL